MHGLRAGMSAAPLMTAARVAAGVTSLTCQERTSGRQQVPAVFRGDRRFIHRARLVRLREARRSRLCHARFAQPNKIRRFEQGTDLRHPKRPNSHQTGDARVSIIAAESASLGEFVDGLSDLPCEAIGGGKISVGKRVLRIGTACFLEPEPRLVNTGLQQMHLPNPETV